MAVTPQPSPSGGRGVAELSGEVAMAWCRRLPGLDIDAPPPNKLKAGWTLDLDLGFPSAPSLISPQVRESAASPLSAVVAARGRVAATRLGLGEVFG
jgi:hypothetical protein